MGKAGKEKKKRKLQEEGPKPPVMSNGLVSLSSQPRPPVPHSGLVSANGRDAKKPKAPAHPDAPSSQCPTEARGSGSGGGASSSSSVSVSAFEVGVATKVLYQMAESPEEFRGKEFKGLRAALHALRQSPGAAMTLGFGSKELSPVQVVSDALRDERWQDALRALKKMRLQKIVPKLGAVCRWVRDCDAAGDGEDPQVLQVLDAVLRTADPPQIGMISSTADPPQIGMISSTADPPQIGMISSTAAAKESLKGLPSISQPSVRCGGRLLTYVDWDPLADQKPCERGETEVGKTMKEFQAMGEAERQEFRGRFSVCHTEKGADRKPPNRHDLSIFLSKENAISLDPSYSLTRRVSVPFIASSSAFFAADLLSSDEADALVKGAEAVGYSPDQPVGGSAVEKKSVLAHALVWMADEAMADEIWRRLKPLVMAGAQGGDTGEENRGTSRCVTADGAVPVGINRRMRFY
eukprot:Cvel_10688.t1-p1 / transcript=Cvel_10688.t1 / gene=Cvel_10688 / organism=Chromera_velia_CCMP2878 / gene_product=hypothetical protein / transcript_product=hypothetical protein / location=Cvel_scaffold649:72797-74384(+) / protein_length=464 / sequence_SO=supercontig / SO=protein_coding / is_pseudo=false